MTIRDQRRAIQQIFPDRVVQMVKFQRQEVGDGGHDMTGGDGFNRAADVVGRDRDIVEVGQISNAPPFE